MGEYIGNATVKFRLGGYGAGAGAGRFWTLEWCVEGGGDTGLLRNTFLRRQLLQPDLELNRGALYGVRDYQTEGNDSETEIGRFAGWRREVEVWK
ncbi:uncharacterized protein ColSpa_02121 [Colletotrichum spaethianum]|uniref:Uncharacterized protein n=1 Tax=Colletotrichum spaethianum TaxID=700344 RepID=A0AA37L8A6_9PEZI|nr:uncharacterized protein ColSpa_02121 [Colletotrichum spaethianum]GKT41940.1 hypothetical protein ColSpa_02121 [Colletotrichum spaethianum]